MMVRCFCFLLQHVLLLSSIVVVVVIAAADVKGADVEDEPECANNANTNNNKKNNNNNNNDYDSSVLSAATHEHEMALGLNALPVHIAAVTGQLQDDIEMCGSWCADVAVKEPTTACRMDPTIVECKGDFYCTTTCALWHRQVLLDSLVTTTTTTTKQDDDDHDGGGSNTKEDKTRNLRPSATCAMFARFDGYLSAKSNLMEPCDESCLLPEIRPHRYPAPTGLGLDCQKGTCMPIFSSFGDILENVPGTLECPCNWFGSDCQDDWIPIEAIEHTAYYGNDDKATAVVATTLTVSSSQEWDTIMANHQPGGVIRIVHRDPDNWNYTNPDHTRVQEQPYALAFAARRQQQDADGGNKKKNTLEILTAPPDMSLHKHPRAVAERVRSLPNGPIQGGNLYVNPSIGGFFNNQWTMLMPFLEENDIENVVLLSTGAGLSGSVSAIQALVENKNNNSKSINVRLYHGVRRIQDLPFQEYLEKVSSSGKGGKGGGFDMTVVESQPQQESDNHSTSTMRIDNDLSPGIAVAVKQGREARQRLLLSDINKEKKKVYVQDVVQHEIESTDKEELSLENTVFVACGRLALLEETKAMLLQTYCGTAGDSYYSCSQNVGQHFFTNI